jgi:aromatic-L-amino-acid decarboxylase
VVATVGTTSTTSIDPVPEVAAIARRHELWLHVDAAYGGAAAICPELRAPGLELADSIVVNPHKWLFVPVDCSVLWLRDARVLRDAFSLVPPYLRSNDGAKNLMDLGPQLGRRFRALKLWFVIRCFGVVGLQERIRNHCRWARELERWLRASPPLEVVAPVPFSTVCFRLAPAGVSAAACDRLNRELFDHVNAQGPVLIAQTEVRGRFVLRAAIGNVKTEERHVRELFRLVRSGADLVLGAAPT